MKIGGKNYNPDVFKGKSLEAIEKVLKNSGNNVDHADEIFKAVGKAGEGKKTEKKSGKNKK